MMSDRSGAIARTEIRLAQVDLRGGPAGVRQHDLSEGLVAVQLGQEKFEAFSLDAVVVPR